MAVTQYIGSRYVPILADPVEWSNAKEYEPLTIVTHEGNSYTSRQFVPKGIDIDNEMYWALTGNYNAQIEQYRHETAQVSEKIDIVENRVNDSLEDALQELENFTFVTPEMFGAKGDGETNDTAAIQTAFDYAKENNVAFVMNKSYVITDTLNFNEYDVYAPNSLIKVKFANRNKPAINISGRFRNFEFGTIIDYDSWLATNTVWVRGWHGWHDKDYAGLHVNALAQSTVSVTCIHNFTSGVLCESGPTGNTQYIAWNVFNIESIRNCRYAYFFWNNHGVWMNANEFNNTEIAYQDATTEFATSQLTRYGIYQQVTDYTSQSLPSFSSNIFNNFKFEHHYNSPLVMAHVVSMALSKFINTRLEYSNITEIPFEVDLTNNWAAYWLQNEYIDGVYQRPTLKITRGTSMRMSYEKCLKFTGGNYTTETINYITKEIDFLDKQIQVSSNRCILDNCLYGKVTTTGNLLTDLYYSAGLSSVITDNHLTTNNFGGTPVVIVKIPDEKATVYLKATQLPYIRCYDADMSPITERSLYGSQTYSAQNTSGNYNYYTPGPNTETWLSFAANVKYVMLLCVDAKNLIIRSADAIEVMTYIDTSDYSYHGLKSDVAPTGNFLPPFSKVWDFSNKNALGAYWLYEGSGGSYAWVRHES